MSWICQHCNKSVPERMEICWACGSDTQGNVDPEFQHADEYKPVIKFEKTQFRVSNLLKVTTIVCLALSIINPTVQRYCLLAKPNALELTIGIVLVAYVSYSLLSMLIMFVAWLLTLPRGELRNRPGCGVVEIKGEVEHH